MITKKQSQLLFLNMEDDLTYYDDFWISMIIIIVHVMLIIPYLS